MTAVALFKQFSLAVPYHIILEKKNPSPSLLFEEQWGNTLLNGQILEKSMKTSVCNEYLRF